MTSLPRAHGMGRSQRVDRDFGAHATGCHVCNRLSSTEVADRRQRLILKRQQLLSLYLPNSARLTQLPSKSCCRRPSGRRKVTSEGCIWQAAMASDAQPIQLMDLPDTALQQLLLSVPAPIAFMLATTCRKFRDELQHNRGAIMHKMTKLPALYPVTTSQPLDKPHWVEQLVALQWQVKAGTMLLMMLTDETVTPEDVWEQVLKGAEPDFARMCHELGCHMQSALVPYGAMPPLLVWLLVLQLQGVNAAEFDLGSSGKDAKLKFAPAASRLQQLASKIYCNIKLLVRVEFATSMIESFWPLALQA